MARAPERVTQFAFMFRSLPVFLLATVLALCGVASGQGATRVRVSADASREGVRLLLTHSAPVQYAIQASRSRLTIRYSQPVRVDPDSDRFESSVVTRYRVRDETTLVVYLGRDYERYEKYELQNPFRLVLDVRARPGRSFEGEPASEQLYLAPGTIIVLDPGHGGVEEGAVGPGGLKEKDVALQIARSLKQSLQLVDPDISVVLTRDRDRLLGLDERTAIANENRADLFVSLHLNASPRADAHGAETYYLSTKATDDEARTTAALENRSHSSPSSPTKTHTTESGRELELILWDLAQNRHLAASAALAENVQRQLNELTGTRNRGVRQAPFRVLMGATMPAVLVEVGFVSNPTEEERFRDPDYRGRVVDALTRAIRDFLRDLERSGGGE